MTIMLPFTIHIRSYSVCIKVITTWSSDLIPVLLKIPDVLLKKW